MTNEAPVRFDGRYYKIIAREGLNGPTPVPAPFLYRPAVPLLARTLSRISGLPVKSAFKVIASVSAVVMLLASYAVARHFVRKPRPLALSPHGIERPEQRSLMLTSLCVTLVIGLSAQHVKFPLFFYSLIDGSAYALLILAFLALLKERLVLALLVSCVGLFFKEFLAVPWLLVLLILGRRAWHARSLRTSGPFMLALLAGVVCLALPRLLLHPAGTYQEVDPFNDPSTLSRLWANPLDLRRDLNVLLACVSYGLPLLMMLTPERTASLRRVLRPWGALLAASGCLVVILAMYGGSNLNAFVAYSAPVLIAGLATMLQEDVRVPELVVVVVAMVLFNRIPFVIPSPDTEWERYLDFYPGFGSRVNGATLLRFLEAGAWILAAAVARRWHPSRRHASEAHA